jgi:translation initiation factor 1
MADKPFHNPFASLGALRDRLPEPEAAPETPSSPPALSPAPKGTVTRAVIRTERSGRGGKEVTVVEQLGLPEKELGRWLTALKGALGCGGTVEGDTLVLQGDHRERLPPILSARGVRKIVRGT